MDINELHRWAAIGPFDFEGHTGEAEIGHFVLRGDKAVDHVVEREDLRGGLACLDRQPLTKVGIAEERRQLRRQIVRIATSEQQAVLADRFQENEADWEALLTQVRAEIAKGTAFNSPDVRYLARRWLGSMKSFVDGDNDIYAALTRMYQQEGLSTDNWDSMDATTFEYMLKAVSFLTLGEVTESLIPVTKIFSPATQQVLQRGEHAIRQINFDILGTEGFLLGLLADGNNLVAQVLAELNVTFANVQPLVAKWLGVRPHPPEGWQPTRLPFALRAKRVIELALERAQSPSLASTSVAESTQIEPEHLLLGILDEAKESGGLATYILQEELGIDLAQLEQLIESVLAQR